MFVIRATKIREYNFVVDFEMKMYVPVSRALLHQREKTQAQTRKLACLQQSRYIGKAIYVNGVIIPNSLMQTNCCDG